MIPDTCAGRIGDPQSLHKYLYANANPVMNSDPSGQFTLPGLAGEVAWHVGVGIEGLGVALGAYGLAKFVVSACNYVSATISLALGPTDPYNLEYYRAQQVAAFNGMFEGMVTAAAGYGLYVFGRAMAAAAALWQVAPHTEVWTKPPMQRGIEIEEDLALSEYSGWYRVAGDAGGKFPLVDFQKGNNLVSLKTVDTTGISWMGRMQEHIVDLGTRGAAVNTRPANMILDIRVQPGGLNAAKSLIQYGKQHNVTVLLKEYP
jgi:hypothetical protein